MQTPLISVIIPLFNRAHFIGDTIESVLVQTFMEWELLIVNDGSTDGSLEIARGYAERDQRIRILDQPNGGVIAARNNGIAAAVGEFIFPLDDDDKISPDALSEFIVAARLGLGDVIYSETERFGAQKELFVHPLPTRENIPYGNCVVCSALYRKSDWEKYGGYDVNMIGGFEDWEFWLNFIAEEKIFYRVPKPLFFYRIAPNSRSQKIDKRVKARIKKYLRKKHSALYDLPRVKIALSSRLILIFVKIFHSMKTYRRIRQQLSVADYPKIENPKLIMTLIIKDSDEPEKIRQNLIFHKTKDIDGFIVTDNVSTNGINEVLQEYKAKGWILDIIDKSGQGYCQHELVHRMASMARHKYHADWIINAYVDEFWYPKSGTLKAEISNSAENMLYVPANNISKVIVRAKEYVHIHPESLDADMAVRHKRCESKDIMIYRNMYFLNEL